MVRVISTDRSLLRFSDENSSALRAFTEKDLNSIIWFAFIYAATPFDAALFYSRYFCSARWTINNERFGHRI